jgi:hypothetical protein
MASLKPVSRSTLAFQSARIENVSTNQESEPWTWPKAPAVCVSTPSGISPVK